MNAMNPITPVTPEQFEVMDKDERLNYELIDGIVMMSPSPSFEHQTISNKLVFKLNLQLENTPCQPLYEYDIRVNQDIYKPDVMVFCQENDELPRIVFEIISPTSKHRDLVTKVAKYEQAGIAEYWILDPKSRSITVHDFVGGETEIYIIGDTIHSKAIPGIVIAVADIFSTRRPAQKDGQ